FIYSLITGKATVSKSSFFDLFEPALKEDFGYLPFLRKDGGDILGRANLTGEAVANSLTFSNILAKQWTMTNDSGTMLIPNESVSIPSDPGSYTRLARNRTNYPVNPELGVEALPSLMSHPYSGERRIYQLTETTSPRTNAGM